MCTPASLLPTVAFVVVIYEHEVLFRLVERRLRRCQLEPFFGGNHGHSIRSMQAHRLQRTGSGCATLGGLRYLQCTQQLNPGLHVVSAWKLPSQFRRFWCWDMGQCVSMMMLQQKRAWPDACGSARSALRPHAMPPLSRSSLREPGPLTADWATGDCHDDPGAYKTRVISP